MKIYLISLILIITISYINTGNKKENKKNDYDLLYEWGKNNSLFISNKIAMNYTNENDKNFYVKKKIKENETIMTIPKSLLLNVESALNLLGKKVRKQYENYKKQQFEAKNYANDEILSYRIDQSFLAYLMTIANKSKKNKLYQYYQYFFNTFETNLERFPVFFNSEQLRLLMFSLFGNEVIQTKEMFEEEFGILQKEISKKVLDQDEYIKYRIFTFNKFLNISGTSYIIPFIDMLETNPINYNLQINYTLEKDSITVISIKDIKPEDKLKMAVVQMTNSGSLITYGRIYEENKHYVENFRIPKISTAFLRERNIDPLMANGEVIDLSQKNYYEQIIPLYIELSKMLKEDGSKASALRLFLENIKSIRNEYNKLTVSELFKNFFIAKNVQNIRSVLDTEKYYLDKKIREMKIILNKYAREKEHDL